MKNIDVIREFVKGNNSHNAINHIGYRKNTFWNYSTVLAEVDRNKKTVLFNITKYSVTTGRIQNMLRRELEAAGFVIEEVVGAAANVWNYGYQGAPTLKKSDFA